MTDTRDPFNDADWIKVDKPTPVWTMGWNIPGYLPEMEPYGVAGKTHAEAELIENVKAHLDDRLDEDLEVNGVLFPAGPDWPDEKWDEVQVDVNKQMEDHGHASVLVRRAGDNHDLGLHYWVVPLD